MSKSKRFFLETFLLGQAEAYHIARTSISSKEDLVYHSHDYAEIFWIKEGNGSHFINGEEVKLQPGTLVMIRSDDEHSFNVNPQHSNLIITNIAFHKNNLDYFRRRYFPNLETYFWTKEKSPFSLILPPDQLNELSSITDRLLSSPRNYLNLDFLIVHIFRMICSLKLDYPHIPHWLAFALENYNTSQQFRNGSGGFVALCNRSTDHVNRTLKRYLKQSLSETVNKARLGYVASQLTMTNSPVKTICFECGYENISYFYRLFKKFYGITPAEYREKRGKTSI